MTDVEALARALERGDRRALAKAITLAESSLASDRALNRRLLGLLPKSEVSLRLGVTGAPGVGKSTFIDRLGSEALAAGKHPAVLAYDPAGRQGGSILGDKTRMHELTRQTRAFVRASSNRGVSGGVGHAVLDSIRLCEAAGFNLIIVETVGVGQSEVSVADVVDALLVLVLPNAGDELQGIKKGLLEYADLVLVNKADGSDVLAAERALGDYRRALALVGFAAHGAHPTPEVLSLSALEARGVREVWERVLARYDSDSSSGRLALERHTRLVALFRRQLSRELERRVLERAELREYLKDVELRLAQAKLGLDAAVDEVLARALAGVSSVGEVEP